MKRFDPPPGETRRLHAERVLVIAPHFDDEMMGCGGLLLQLIGDDASVQVLFLSDGSGGVEEVEDRRAYASRRSSEAAAVAASMGFAATRELGLRDGGLLDHVAAIATAIGDEIAAHRPDLVLVPAPTEVTSDHRAAFLALHDVLHPLRPGDPLYDPCTAARFVLYEVNRLLHPDVLVDVGGQIAQLEAAIRLYGSQLERHDYLAAAVGLRRYRTLSLPAGTSAAEAYRTLSLDDFTTRSAIELVAHLDGIADLPLPPPVAAQTDGPSRHRLRDALASVARGVYTRGVSDLVERWGEHVELPLPPTGPTVSVIVRTKNRPVKLEQALDSVARGIYRSVQLVLVNDGGTEPEVPPDFPFEIVRRTLSRSRGPAAAAQTGLQAATGRWVCFLDDDDLFFPEHLAKLVSSARDGDRPVVYSDAAVAAYERRKDGAWSCRERRLPYSRDFDAARLLLDNYIPFLTVLSDRGLAADVGFDLSLPFFEDWDFLIRLSALTPFEHLRAATCEYRHFRGDPSHLFGAEPEASHDIPAARARLYRKHADRLAPEVIAAAVTELRGEASRHEERWRALASEAERRRSEAGGS